MNLTARLRFIITAACMVIGAAALAQTGAGRLYNPSTETTLKGTVDKVSTVTGRRGWNGIHLSLRSDGQTCDVHLGPAAYLEQSGFSFSPGDQIQVVGSRVRVAGADVVVAREITRGGKVLTLRDPQGFPMWSRRGGGSQ